MKNRPIRIKYKDVRRDVRFMSQVPRIAKCEKCGGKMNYEDNYRCHKCKVQIVWYINAI